MSITKTRYKTIAHEDYEVIIVDMKGEENTVGRVFKKFGQQEWSLKPSFMLEEKQKLLLFKSYYSFGININEKITNFYIYLIY